MQPYELTLSAEDDLKDIARYTLKQWGKKQSLQYLLFALSPNAILKYG
jgi:plasmid stabilization system protein ParE